MTMSEIKLEITSHLKPVQTNRMYWAAINRSGPKVFAYLTKTEPLKKYQKDMAIELKETVDPEVLDKFKNEFNKGLYTVKVNTFCYFYRNEYFSLDVSNLIKAYEDCISEFVQIDDSATSSYCIEKIPTDIKKEWTIHTVMELVKRDPLVEGINVEKKNNAEIRKANKKRKEELLKIRRKKAIENGEDPDKVIIKTRKQDKHITAKIVANKRKKVSTTK